MMDYPHRSVCISIVCISIEGFFRHQQPPVMLRSGPYSGGDGPHAIDKHVDPAHDVQSLDRQSRSEQCNDSEQNGEAAA